MREKHVVWPLLGAAIALLFAQEMARSGFLLAFIAGLAGAAIGLVLALLWR